jgi:hypothetical protein
VKEEEENERKRNKQLENLQVKSRGKRATHAPSWHGRRLRRCAAAAGKMLGTSAAAGRRAHDGKANDSST